VSDLLFVVTSFPRYPADMLAGPLMSGPQSVISRAMIVLLISDVPDVRRGALAPLAA
jgi:hypothetical protein